MLRQIKNKENKTLLEIVESNNLDMSFQDSSIFSYSKKDTEYKFHIKFHQMTFNKSPCHIYIINDYTAFHKLAKLEESYQKVYLASVVHDIRTPMQGIIGIFEMMNTPNITEEEKLSLKVGMDTCKLLIFLTHDITDLGQIEMQKLKIKQEGFNTADVVIECFNLLKFGYEKKGIKLVFKQEQVTCLVFSDKHRYMQILLNLLGNALKFTLAGSVTVRISYEYASRLLFTEVSDTGIGIKAENIQQLFKLFGRIDASSSINPQGVGLGLTICKKLSEAMGGSISVRSVYGQGSSFSFSIKMNEEVKEEKTTTIEHGNNPLKLSEIMINKCKCKCKHILIVDDTPFSIFVLKGYLKGTGIECDEVTYYCAN